MRLFRLNEYLKTQDNDFFVPDITWFYYGVHRQVTKYEDEDIETYYIQRPVPVSNNLLTYSDILLIRLNETDFYLMLKEESYVWPEAIIDDYVSCLKHGVICKVLQVLNNTYTSARCRSFGASNNLNEITCPAKLWYVTNMYFADEICRSVNFSSNGTILFATKSDGLNVFTGMPISTNSLKAYVTSIAPNNMSADISILAGQVNSDVDQACFTAGYHSIFDVLFTLDNSCPVSLIIYGVKDNVVYLDAWEMLTLNVELMFNNPELVSTELLTQSLLDVHVTNSDQLNIQTKYRNEHPKQGLTIHFQQKWLYPSVTTLNISTKFYHSKCNNISHVIRIAGVCPFNKQMIFYYPFINDNIDLLKTNLEDDDGINRVFDLPTNYQPPSSMGRAIPMTSNVYNADPSMKMYREKYIATQTGYVYKQCKDKRNRLVSFFLLSWLNLIKHRDT